MEVKRKEILRYLGYGNHAADENVYVMIEEAVEELLAVAAPKSIYRSFELELKADQVIDFTCFQVKSRNLTRNLQNCSKIVLFAATLGSGVDQLARKYNKVQMSKAVVIQAAAATMIEEYCDKINDEISQIYQAEGYYTRQRFSPGYGDFSLKHQKDMIEILECPKKIGLTLTDSLIMMPSKSVTAVIGLSRENQRCHKQGCEVCDKINCAYKRG